MPLPASASPVITRRRSTETGQKHKESLGLKEEEAACILSLADRCYTRDSATMPAKFKNERVWVTDI